MVTVCFSVLSMARLAMMVHRPSNVTEAGFGDPQRHVGGSPIVVPELAFRDALASCRLSNGSLRVYLGLLGTTAVTASPDICYDA